MLPPQGILEAKGAVAVGVNGGDGYLSRTVRSANRVKEVYKLIFLFEKKTKQGDARR